MSIFFQIKKHLKFNIEKGKFTSFLLLYLLTHNIYFQKQCNYYIKMLNVRYKILPQYNLIIEFFSGEITLDAILSAKKSKNSMPEFDPTFNHLIDLRHAKTNISLSEIKEIAKFQEENKQYIKKRKSAFLADSPEQTSLTILFTLSMQNLPIDFEIFSTTKAALNWLDLWYLSERDYEKFIAELI